MDTLMATPYDILLEQHILGVMLSDPAKIGDVAGQLKAEYFYEGSHQRLCKYILKLWDQGEYKVTLIELAPYIEEIGTTISYITDLIGSIASTYGLPEYVENLRKIAQLREFTRELGSAQADLRGIRQPKEIEQEIANKLSRLTEIAESTINTDSLYDAKEAALEFFEEFLEKSDNPNGLDGLSSGFPELDELTLGLSDYIVVAARPSIGKTALALQIALNVSVKKDQSTAIFSLEMSRKKVMARMLANFANIDSQAIRTGYVMPEEKKHFDIALDKLSKSNFVIDDTPSQTISQIKAKAKKIKKDKGLNLVIIDYLGLIETDERYNSTYEKVTAISKGLKALSKELKVPVVVLAQLNRGNQARQDKRPYMSELRDSGQIEQDADQIWLLHRDDYYERETERKNIIEIDIAKNRDGSTGVVELYYDRSTQRFISLEKFRNR